MSAPEPEHSTVDALLQDDRRMLAVLMDNLPGMVYRCQSNADWTMDFVSQGCINVTGYTADELVNNAVVSFGELIHPDDRAMVAITVGNVLGERQPFQLQYRLNHRTKGMLWVWEHGRGVYSPEGALVCLEGYITDVTERVLALEQLKHSEDQYRRLIENAQDVIFRYELLPERRLAFVSPAIEGMTGYSVAEHYQDSGLFDRIVHPDDVRKYGENLTGMASPEPFITVRLQHKDGRWVWTEQRNMLVRNDNGQVIAVEGVIRDVTRRKETEEMLRHKMAEEAALVAVLGAILNPQTTATQVAQLILDHIRALTGSAHGFVASVDAASGNLISYTLTAMMDKECQITGLQRSNVFTRRPDGSFPGIWGHSLNERKAFFTNEPASHPASSGTPEGHVALKNVLVVPVLNEDELLGQIALANVPGGFCESDLEMAQRLAGFYKLYLQQWGLRERLQISAAQLRRHNRILGVVAETASRFLQAIDWNREMDMLLAGLGQALDANRAFIFENYVSENGELAARMLFGWVSAGQTPIEQPGMASAAYTEAGLVRWAELLGSGKAIIGHVNDFPQHEQALFKVTGTQWLLAMPIFTGYDWYGYLGFGSDHADQGWATAEVDALQAAAGIVGAAIERRKSEAALRRRTEELERFEKLVVGRELKMIELKQRIEKLETEIRALKGPAAGRA